MGQLPHSIAQHLLAAIRSPYMHTYQQMPAKWALGFVLLTHSVHNPFFHLSARTLAATCSRCRCTSISSAELSVVCAHQRVCRISRCRCSSSISAKSALLPVRPCRHQAEETSVK